jgi:hypothetical protein
MNEYLRALLGKPDCDTGLCSICAQRANNMHHVIPGDRKNKDNPLIRLCGSGVTGHHGLAHEKRLHFRYTDWWEYLITDEPTKYEKALAMKGWRRVL